MPELSLEQKIAKIKNAQVAIKDAIINKGGIPSGNIETYADAISDLIVYNNETLDTITQNGTYRHGDSYTGFDDFTVNIPLQSLTINPSTSTQTITHSNHGGYNNITVNPVTSSIDNNCIASNIRQGSSILGINGSVVELKGETRSVSLTSSSGNTFTPSTGKNGITSITVTPTNQARTVTPSTSQQTLTVNSGYSGNGTITVNAVTSSIDNNIRPEYIKKDVTILSVTGTLEGSGDIITNINDNYLVKTNGDMELLKTDSYTLGSKDTTISQTNALQIAYEHDSNIKNIQLDRITTISGNRALYYAFYSCTNLTNVDLSSLTTLSGSNALNSAFQDCTNLTNVDLSSLTTLSGEYALNSAFENCTSLTNVDLSSLTTVSGDYALAGVFYGCTNLTSVNFSKLAMISGSSGFTGQYALQSAFSSCTLLTTLSFPMLKSTSFGYYTNQFNNMLNGVTGCTVHFPSNLQSVIGSWRDLLTGFSGTNTTVLFDLPTTT